MCSAVVASATVVVLLHDLMGAKTRVWFSRQLFSKAASADSPCSAVGLSVWRPPTEAARASPLSRANAGNRLSWVVLVGAV